MELQINLTKSFGSFQQQAQLTISGERIGIFGESGSGKSTLVSMVAGLLEPDSGEIVLDGDLLFSSSRRRNVPPQDRRIAMVFQQPALFPHLSVKNNLLYGFKRCAKQHRRITMESLLDVLQIGPLLERGVNRLSGGEKQRIALGRAVLANPRLLLMDEPLSALDDTLRYQIIPYLRSVSEQFGIPYLFISHSLLEMQLMTDQVVVVDKGAVAPQIPVDQVARQRMGQSPAGYLNLCHTRRRGETHGVPCYCWGNVELLISTQPSNGSDEAVFQLSSKDIILCKRHPEAISARNLLPCTVRKLFEAGRKVGVELDCNGSVLVAEIVADAAQELAITAGSTIWAAIKASAFRRL